MQGSRIIMDTNTDKKKIDFEDIKKMYLEKGLTYKEIAIYYECSVGRIRKIAKRHGLKSIRGKSKTRKVIIQKSLLPLSLENTDLFSNIETYFTSKEMEIILGTLLGDSSLKKRQNKKYISYNVYMTNSGKQLEYLRYKRSFFRDKVCNNIRKERDSSIIKIKHKDCNVDSLFAFSTKPSNLDYIFSILNNGKRKIITKRYLEYLTPLSLAIWYQDNGSYNLQNRVIRIATMCFSQEENNIIKNYFYDNLKMPCFLEKTNCGFGYSLVLTQNSTKKLFNLIRPYICSSMLYKCPLDFDPSETLKADNSSSASKNTS